MLYVYDYVVLPPACIKIRLAVCLRLCGRFRYCSALMIDSEQNDIVRKSGRSVEEHKTSPLLADMGFAVCSNIYIHIHSH